MESFGKMVILEMIAARDIFALSQESTYLPGGTLFIVKEPSGPLSTDL
jgi:hypothetical protein